MKSIAEAHLLSALADQADAATLAENINALLPQTQCTQCGFSGCRPYAEAIAAQQAEINQCPPGGAAGIAALAKLLGRAPLPLNPAYGEHTPLQLARIDEARCIGCTLCIQACPVDAILGAAKQMHSVIEDLCTGCKLCLAPCPVDCIAMFTPQPLLTWTRADADAARIRMEQRQMRQQREHNEPQRKLEAPLRSTQSQQHVADPALAAEARKHTLVQAALARAAARQAPQSKVSDVDGKTSS